MIGQLSGRLLVKAQGVELKVVLLHIPLSPEGQLA